ncbi:hypothetical protein SAMN05421505_1013 [Sinosporangium album]|uniref:Uncharacterized protein n=1 Tax=Sinosporangium album TaxID=504805 RepID=A0A1G7QIH2_9ACTN|nr:hypothetical protein [Sinosporangium album]SDF98276.1 hypothetical protein SAMN05421505_1013 [Sinosporangium album]
MDGDDVKQGLEVALSVAIRDLDPDVRAKHEFCIVRAGPRGDMFVGLEDGRFWSGGTPLSAGNEVEALSSVAEGLQDCLMEVLWIVWPECPQHRFGLHVAVHNSKDAVWECRGDRRHTVALVGGLT